MQKTNGNVQIALPELFPLCEVYDGFALSFSVFHGFISTAEVSEQTGYQIIGVVHHPEISLLNSGFVMNAIELCGDDNVIIIVFIKRFFLVQPVGHIRKNQDETDF